MSTQSHDPHLLSPLELPEPSTETVEVIEAIVAQHPSGERRPQQENMIKAVSRSLDEREHLLVQAGTGVGKSLGYLVPLAISGNAAVVSTATNQLSDQIVEKDLPFLNDVLSAAGRPQLSFTVVKGRSNYLCLEKVKDREREEKIDAAVGEQSTFEGLDDTPIDGKKDKFFEARQKGKQTRELIDWIHSSKEFSEPEFDGDRKNVPAVSDATWEGFSSTNDECPGRKNCVSGESCFAEAARATATKSTIVVTNHAMVGTDMLSDEDGDGGKILGPRDVFVFDEVHELDRYLSSSWGKELTVKGIKWQQAVITKALSLQGDDDPNKALVESLSDIADQMLAHARIKHQGEEHMVFDEKLVHLVQDLNSKYTALGLILAAKKKNATGLTKAEEKRVNTAIRILNSALSATEALVDIENPEMVQWAELTEDNLLLKRSPLRVGPLLMEKLAKSDSIMVGTSATITVGGQFDIPVRNFALGEFDYSDNYSVFDSGTPFDYPSQGILYIPSPDDIPIPAGKDREEHSQGVREFLLETVLAAGGRTLFLSTTKWGAINAAKYLRDNGVKTPVLCQFDGPVAKISEEFAVNETSTLCATMGLWHGLNVPGQSLSVVVIDKIPFAPMNHPLLSARQSDAESRGYSGFMDVYVADAQVMLSQGVGRLVRHSEDRGGVALLDPRLRTKPYGRAMVKSLPNFWQTQNRSQFFDALKRLAENLGS